MGVVTRTRHTACRRPAPLVTVLVKPFIGLKQIWAKRDPRATSRGHADMRTLVQSFLADENGATAIEYGLIAAGISVAIIVTVQSLGTKLSNVFGNVSNAIN